MNFQELKIAKGKKDLTVFTESSNVTLLQAGKNNSSSGKVIEKELMPLYKVQENSPLYYWIRFKTCEFKQEPIWKVTFM